MSERPFELGWLGGAAETRFRHQRPEAEAMPWGSLDASAYPPYDGIVASMEDRRQAFTDWFNALPDDKAAEELDEEARMFGQTFAGMVGAIGVHDNYHVGQLSLVRKHLGMGRIFG